jgi:hypothetical protein
LETGGLERSTKVCSWHKADSETLPLVDKVDERSPTGAAGAAAAAIARPDGRRGHRPGQHDRERLEPASAAVPTTAEKKQQDDDDDQKCRGVHAGLRGSEPVRKLI